MVRASVALLASAAAVVEALPPINPRFCAHGHDYVLQNGEKVQEGLSYRLCMDQIRWFHRDEMACVIGPAGRAPCNVTGMHDTTIVNRTHRGRITPTAPGEVRCTVSEIPIENQCLGPYTPADDCMAPCGDGAVCCRDPATAAQFEGTCYKVSSCDMLASPACNTPPYIFLQMDENSTFQGKANVDDLGKVDHWMSERWANGELVGLMHYYLDGDAKPQHLVRDAYELHFDKHPHDGGTNITQLGIRDWHVNYTTDVPEILFVPDADPVCQQVIAMALQV